MVTMAQLALAVAMTIVCVSLLWFMFLRFIVPKIADEIRERISAKEETCPICGGSRIR